MSALACSRQLTAQAANRLRILIPDDSYRTQSDCYAQPEMVADMNCSTSAPSSVFRTRCSQSFHVYRPNPLGAGSSYAGGLPEKPQLRASPYKGPSFRPRGSGREDFLNSRCNWYKDFVFLNRVALQWSPMIAISEDGRRRKSISSGH
jgi:hypothetical protein